MRNVTRWYEPPDHELPHHLRLTITHYEGNGKALLRITGRKEEIDAFEYARGLTRRERPPIIGDP